jgi:4-hydroxyacetophenone monooxygenase
MYGPNSNPGGGSYTTVAEAVAEWITGAVKDIVSGDVASMEIKSDLAAAYNDEVDRKHAEMIWTHPGMSTYYRNSRGRVVTQMPWRVVEYLGRLQRLDLDSFDVLSHDAEVLS